MRLLIGLLGALVLASPASAATKRPDLQVSAVKLAGTQVTGTVKNAGKAKAGKSTLELKAGTVRLTTVSVKALAVRKSATFKATVRTPSTLAAGRYAIQACADSAKKVKESKETNNCRATSATLVVVAPAPAPPAPAPIPQPAPAPITTPTVVAPDPTPAGPGAPAITGGPTGTVNAATATFTFSGTAPFECRLDGAAFAPCASPITYNALLGGAHTFTVRNTNGQVSRQWLASFEAPAPGPADAPAPEPAAQAPAPEAGESTLIGESTSFLYSGPNAVQKGVAAGTITDQRAAVLRGTVRNRLNGAIPGVRVTVLDHPEYGQTATQADGGFDLAVNGGGPLTLVLERAGYVPVQRTVEPAPQDFEGVETITMIPYDDTVTGIDLKTPKVVQSSVVNDGGARRATLMFEAGTDADATLPDGTKVDLGDTLNVRATEFTVGPTGPSAMPGELPASSAYTYAVEYSIDEADRLGATDVRFDKPVATYVDNFLGFPVGTPVPSGYYDRELARWVAGSNGVVIRIVSEANGLATVEGISGLDEAERRNLATLYDPGKSLWRVEVDHFTPWDYNWPYGPPDGAGPPGMGGPNGPNDGNCNSGGSIIGCESQTLGEDATVAGTPFMLRYSSDRVPGRRSEMTLDIPLTPDTPPNALKGVTLDIEVAGQTIHRAFAPSARADTFTWDGKDAYGRVINGQQTARVKLSYIYPTVYREPAAFQTAFAAFGGARLTSNPSRTEISSSQEWSVPVGGLTAPPSSIGGWNLDVHQIYDPVGRTLYGGDGSKRSAIGQNFDAIRTDVGPPRSGGRASVELDSPEGVVKAPDGTLYIADTGANVIRRVAADGVVSVFAGTGDADFADGPALDAAFDDPADVALGADGALYVADRGNERVRKIVGGVVSTVAGTGAADYTGDGGPALAATFDGPSDVAVAADGTLYVTDRFNGALRRIGPDGTIATALDDLRQPGDVALRSTDGAVLVADTGNHRVLALGADGTQTTVAGDGAGVHRGDGGPAVDASLDRPSAVAPRADGGFLVAEAGSATVRSVASDGIITTVAGSPRAQGSSGDGGPAPSARLTLPQALIAGTGESFLALDAGTDRIRAVEPAMPALGIGEFMIPSDEGEQLYVFTQAGRHDRTLDALTGEILFKFGYGSSGRLMTVTDDKQRVTTIVRDTTGKPLRIEAPHGFVTQLATDANGYLTKIEDPAGGKLELTYDAGGLMKTLTDPRGGAHAYTYDAAGRLLEDRNGERGVQTLSRNAETGAVTLTTAEGRKTTYVTEELSTGEVVRTVTDPAGGETTSMVGPDGLTTVDRPTGERETYRYGPDPRFGMSAPILTSVVTEQPSGRTRTSQSTRSVDLASPTDPLSLTRLLDTLTVNGRSSASSYDATTRTLTTRSPSGAPAVTVIDGARRPLRFTLPNVEDVTFEYNAEGYISKRTQGERVWRYEYDARGLNSKAIDPEGLETTYAYDAAGRAVEQTLPGGRKVALAYDTAGSISSLTPPGATVAHALGYTKQGMISSYTAPGQAAMQLGYDKDDLLTSLDRPGAGDATLAYTTGGRLSTLSEPAGDVTYTYAGNTTRRASVTAPGQTVTTTYDGALVRADTFSGAASGVVSRHYDDDFRVDYSTIDDETVYREYDDDGLLIDAGDLSIDRSDTGLVTGTTLDAITSEQANDEYGEAFSWTFRGAGGLQLWGEAIERDRAGRVTKAGQASYERVDGRLTKETGPLGTFQYTYDANGNMSRVGNAATFGPDDRLLTWGNATFTYQPSGELASKVVGAETTLYSYDARGNLRRVTQPGGVVWDYTYDGLGRRTAIRRNGQWVAGYIYGEAIGPSAEVSENGTVVKRFVYGTRANVPEYMTVGNTTYRFLLDHRGSVREVRNAASGALVQKLDYDGYGRMTVVAGAGFQPFGFAGGLYDAATGFVHFDARDYDPETGRWTAKDPIGFDGGDTNVYAYVSGDPVSFVDPSGQIIPLVIAASIIGGGLVNGAMEGIKSAAAGCSMGQILGSAGRGFVSGSVGTAAGMLAGAATKNPYIGGAVGGAVADGVNQLMSGNGFDPVSLGVAAATGPISIGGKLLPLRGRPASIWRPRGPGTSLTYGPNSNRIIGQTAIDNAFGNALGTGINAGINAARGCPTSSC